MKRRRSAAAGALALGLAAAAAARADQSHEPATTELVVPLDRSAVEVISEFAAETCQSAATSRAGGAPRVRAGSDAPDELERALVSATEARMRTAPPDAQNQSRAAPAVDACLLFAERRGRMLAFEIRARDASRVLAPVTAEVRWDAELAAIADSSRAIAEGDVRATSAPLDGRGYVAAATTRTPGAGALLYAVRAEGVDVYTLALDARGRVRASRLASGERPTGVRAPAPPRRPLATTDARGAEVEVTWADLRDPYSVSIEESSLGFTPGSRCAESGHRTWGLCAIRVSGRDYFSNRLLRDEAIADTLPSAFYARVEASIRGADGIARQVSALATAGGRLRITVRPHGSAAPRRARRGGAGVSGHGLAIAVADVDLDGRAEVLASSDRPFGEGDRLTLYRVRSVGTVLRLWRSAELAGSVTVAAAADVDEDGREELLAIEDPPSTAGEARLWIVR